MAIYGLFATWTSMSLSMSMYLSLSMSFYLLLFVSLSMSPSVYLSVSLSISVSLRRYKYLCPIWQLPYLVDSRDGAENKRGLSRDRGWVRSIDSLGASPFMRNPWMIQVTFTQSPSRWAVPLMSSSPAGTAFIGLSSFLLDVSFLIFGFYIS